MSKNATKVSIACSKAAACAGSIQVVLAKHGKGKKVVLATGTYSVAAGSTGTVTLHLTPAGRTRLGKTHHLSSKLVIAVKGGKSVERTVSLSKK